MGNMPTYNVCILVRPLNVPFSRVWILLSYNDLKRKLEDIVVIISVTYNKTIIRSKQISIYSQIIYNYNRLTPFRSRNVSRRMHRILFELSSSSCNDVSPWKT